VTPLEQFVEAIIASPETVFNPWTQDCPDDGFGWGPMGRSCLLNAHLSNVDPLLILVGEAPGYQGCRMSGVPFTSEYHVLAGGIPRVSRAWQEFGCPAMARQGPWREPSATVIWGSLHELGLADRIVMWNACPWHPHKPDELYTNRAPTGAELRAGLPALEALRAMFPDTKLVAVGNVAAKQLRHLGVQCQQVRHPAYGGATDFRNGLKLIVENP
jgi:uracil-DNA glycosylase